MPFSFFWTEDGPDCAGELMSALAMVRCSVLVGENGSGIGGDVLMLCQVDRRPISAQAGWAIGVRSAQDLARR